MSAGCARRCSASCSTDWASATTAQSGAASFCWPTIAITGASARLKPVAMPGGAQAIRQPWRNLYAHLMAAIGWAELTAKFSGLDLYEQLHGKRRVILDAMIAKHLNSPTGIFMRALVRRGGCSAGSMQRTASLRGGSGDPARGAGGVGSTAGR